MSPRYRGGAVLACLLLAAALAPAAAANGKGQGNRQAFIGLWEGIDPLDGSAVQVSISDIEEDGILEYVLREDFFTVCATRGAGYAFGRGVAAGQGSVVGKGILEVETTFRCVSDAGEVDDEPLTGTFQYRLESRGRILVVPETSPGVPEILLHKIAP